MAIRSDRRPKDTIKSQNADKGEDLEIEQELAQTSLERGMFRRLWPLLGPVRARVFAVIAIELLLVTTIFLRPWFVSQVIDHGFLREPGQLHIRAGLITAMIAGLAASWVFRFGLAGA
jgi:ATP-binding cassette subfamily B protein